MIQWLVIGVFLVIVYCIICRPRTSPFRRGDRVLLVTAHPDDECMFFGPTLCHLSDHKIPVKVVCLSTGTECLVLDFSVNFDLGNFRGQGDQRVKELAKAIAVYNGPSHACLDEFRDGPFGWEPSRIREVITDQVRDFRASVIVTFDDYGVSGHKNHKSCSILGRDEQTAGVRVLYLESVPLFRKFTATMDLMATSMCAQSFVVAGSWRSIRAMMCHKTQLEWFRLLYIFFSRYMTINSFRVRT